MKSKENRILVAVDISNFEYLSISAAFTKWKDYYPDDASFLHPPKETDQSNLPNLLNIDSFRKVLSMTVQQKLESINWILKNNHQMEIDMAEGIDVICAEDAPITNNFRKLKYPEYKAQRKLLLKSYDVFAIKDYIQDVLFKELEIEEKLGYKIVKVDDCESDDVIAVLMNSNPDYMCRVLISSDRDFLQLEGVHQYDWWGNKIERKIKGHDEFEMNAKEFLLWKILRGDVSDNIKNVFPKYGDVKSYKLVKDKPLLRRMFSESQEAYDRYKLNKELIDFRSIPSDMVSRISGIILEKLTEPSLSEKVENFTLESCIEF
jgi:5'-3' exonuclease